MDALQVLVRYGYKVEATCSWIGVAKGEQGQVIEATPDRMIRVRWEGGAEDWFSAMSAYLIKVVPRNYYSSRLCS